MIQRIQTVYMLAGVVAILMMLLFPLASWLLPEATVQWTALGLSSLTPEFPLELMDWSLLVLLLVMLAVPLVCIFLYKRRWLQLRFLIFSGILNVLFYALFFFEKGQHTQWLLEQSTSGGSPEITYNYILLAMPLLGVFCDVMAMRGVLHDIALLKSLERLR
jgi:hypothetical protein